MKINTLKDSQGNIIRIGNKLKSSQGGVSLIKLVDIVGNIGIFVKSEVLLSSTPESIICIYEKPIKMTQKSLEISKWVVYKESK